MLQILTGYKIVAASCSLPLVASAVAAGNFDAALHMIRIYSLGHQLNLGGRLCGTAILTLREMLLFLEGVGRCYGWLLGRIVSVTDRAGRGFAAGCPPLPRYLIGFIKIVMLTARHFCLINFLFLMLIYVWLTLLIVVMIITSLVL